MVFLLVYKLSSATVNVPVYMRGNKLDKVVTLPYLHKNINNLALYRPKGAFTDHSRGLYGE